MTRSERSRLTVAESLCSLERAFLDLDGDTHDRARWTRLQRALRRFLHPLDGGVFDTTELEASFLELLNTAVIKRVFELHKMTPTIHNSVAVDTAVAVCTRVTECIECARDVHARCCVDRGSPSLHPQTCA